MASEAEEKMQGDKGSQKNAKREQKRVKRAVYVRRDDYKRSLRALAVLTLVSAIMLTGLAIPFAGVAGIATRAGTQAFKDLPDEFKPLPPSEQSKLLAADGTLLAKFYVENRIIIDLKDMSKWVQKAAIAIEDRRFYHHSGVDIQGLFRAVANNLAGQKMQGASTITQQYVKNTRIEIGLQTGDDEAVREASAPTLMRKIIEAKYAVSLEKKMSKDKILEGYLNITPFGPNVYGVQAASKAYFSKDAKDLDIGESALLAGLTQSPVELEPTRYPKRAQTRRDQVLFAMLNEGMITKEQYDKEKARNVKDMLKPSHDYAGCQTAGSAAYFCEYVVAEIYNSEKFGKSVAERRRLLTRGGLTIQSTLDPKKQEAAMQAIDAYVPVGDPSGVKTAIVSVEPGTGKIVAMAQNTNFGNPTDKDPQATQNNYSADQVHGGGAGFQPGSSFKPITLATWFQAGHSAGEVIPESYSYPASAFRSSCPDKAAPSAWTFHNSGGARPGPQSVTVGTNKSLNSVYVGMLSRLDLCEVMKMSQKLGAVPGDGSKPMWTPAAILGSNSVPPIYMANAYATMANRGVYCSPIAMTAVTDQTGKKIDIPSANCHRTIREDVADKTMQTLKGTYYSYGGNINIGREAATKTGTTDNHGAAWLVGTTPNLATAVWVGYSEKTGSLENVKIGGRYYSRVYGMTIPQPMWGTYMRKAVEGMPAERFAAAPAGGATKR